MITRRKFLFGLASLAAGTIAASQLPVFKNDDGELQIEMKEGTTDITLKVPYDLRIKSIYPEDTVIQSNGNTLGVGSVLLKGDSIDVSSIYDDSEIKVGIAKI